LSTTAIAHAPPEHRRWASETRFDARHPGLVILTGAVFGTLVAGVATSRGPVAGVLAVAAVAATLWAVRHPVPGAIAIVASVPALSGMQRGLPVPGLRLSELLAVGFSVMLLATAGAAQSRSWRGFDWLALGYVIVTFTLGLADTLLRGDSLSGDDLGTLLSPLMFFLLYRALLVALPRREDRMRAVDWLLIASLVVSASAMVQALQIPAIDKFFVTFTGEDWSGRLTWAVPRVNGIFPHWTMLAGYLFAILVVCTALLLGDVRGARRRLAIAAAVAASIGLVLTVTIGPMLATLAGVVALAWWYGRAGRMVLYLVVACTVLLIAFQPLLTRRADDQFKTQASSSAHYSLVPATVANRLGFWTEQYIPALEGRWLTGYGPQIPPEVTWKHTESVYITMLLRGGLPLLALYGGLMWSMALLARDVGRRRAPAGEPAQVERAIGRALFVLIVLLALIQVTAPYFATTGLPHVWWVLAALVAAAASPPRRRGATGRARRRSRVAPAAAQNGGGVAAPVRRRPRLAPRLGNLWSEAGVVLAGNVLARGLGFLFPIVLARAIAKDDFGTVYFFIMTGFFVSELVLTGFPTAATRFMAAEGTEGPWLSSAIVGGLPLLAVSVAAGEALAALAHAPSGLMWMVVCGLTIDAYYFGLLRGYRRFKLLATYRVSANLAQLVLLVGAIVAGLDSIAVVVAIYSFVYLVPIVVIEPFARPLWHALHGALRPDRERVRRLTRFALPALVTGTAYAGIIHTDILFVRLLAPDVLSDYAAGRSLAQPVLLVPFAVGIVMLPAVASAGERERWRLLGRALSVAIVFGALSVVVYATAGKAVVDLILPASYHRTAGTLPVLATALALFGVYSMLSQFWLGIGRPGPPALAIAAGALVAIGLQFVLTTAHGAIGAASACACGAAFALVLLGTATVRLRARGTVAPTHAGAR
jgi:O-antigen/teichoic acid export membrane protein